MTSFQIFTSIVVPGVTFHQGYHCRASADDDFYAMPELYYFHPTCTEGIYHFLVLDEFRVPCSL
jgi:hypothetical protein